MDPEGSLPHSQASAHPACECFLTIMFYREGLLAPRLIPKLEDIYIYIYIHSFIPLACAECDDSLPFSGISSIPLCWVLSPATLLHQLFIHSLSPHLAICFLVYLWLLFQNSYTIFFWEFYFLPFSVHAQTNVIYLTVFSLL